MMRKEIEARENEELEKIVELFEKVKNKKHMIQFMAYEPRFVEIIKWLKDYLRIKKGGWIPAEERLSRGMRNSFSVVCVFQIRKLQPDVSDVWAQLCH